ncbi:uncharacterized protein LOC109823552 [Asparagus officinalis]|uniref:uncharacterized protein LOC109823552 n=1 Tax=Asparagus officinalis TaxID=4686 RepID=UPI00098DF871|nr:uncharacterized protein LOC109823552 [Asparagus officinalis]
MSTKTLARAGSSLINRLLVSNPLKQNNVLPNLLQISSNPPPLRSLLDKMRIDRNPSRVQESDAGGGDADALKRIASPDGIYFPCGLPSLRFFIDDEGDDALSNDPLLLLPKRTYQPSTIKRKRTHGYLARKATKGGRKVIKRRIAKGRARIAV